MRIVIPDDVEETIKRLEQFGYTAYLAGGCVRDSVLGKSPKDYDIATDATPEEIEEVFSSFMTLNVGKRFGTIILVLPKRHVEITTFRSDGVYTDGRKPDSVVFSKTVEEDVARRDFTINAMVYNHSTGLLDLFGGVEDLNRKTVRTVGVAEDRFNEDYLRMLRCIRFATVLDFEIETDTYNSIKRNAFRISKISAERIRDEFLKMIESDNVEKALDLLYETDLLNYIFPTLQKTINENSELFDNIKNVMKNSRRDATLRLAILFKFIGNYSDLERFRGTNREKEIIKSSLNFKLDKPVDLVKSKRIMRDVKEIDYVIEIEKAINDSEQINLLKKYTEYIIENNEPFRISDLEIDGTDIVGLGVEKGKRVGDILKELNEIVILNPEKNRREVLIEYTKKMILEEE